jgi:hypothetical protein
MGRPRKNKFEESSIKFERGTEFEHNKVKLPLVKVTCNTPIESNGEKIHVLQTFLVKKDISKRKEIINEYEKDGKVVTDIEEQVISFSNQCPKCNRNGIPKIEGKSNEFDYHARAISPSSGIPNHRFKVDRPYEYWLCYDHETKPKKCRVAKWDQNHLIFLKNGKIYTKLKKFIFPYYIGWKKGELDNFDSFQKFLDGIHS